MVHLDNDGFPRPSSQAIRILTELGYRCVTVVEDGTHRPKWWELRDQHDRLCWASRDPFMYDSVAMVKAWAAWRSRRGLADE